MPSFDIDVTDKAIEYTKLSISTMPGNPGQEVLVNNLEYDGYCIVTVDIAGTSVETSASGELRLRSSHPDAIEIIMKAAENNFNEFVERLGGTSGEAYNGLNIIETIRQDSIDEAFGDL